MKSVIVRQALVTRTLRPRLFDAVSSYELVDAVQRRYQFRQVPTVQDIFSGASANQPSNFIFGKIERDGKHENIEHITLTYYGNWGTTIAVATKTNTEIGEYVLEDLERWAAKEYNINTTPLVATTYHSQLHVEFDRDLNERFKALKPIGEIISQRLRTYGFAEYPDFEPIGFSMHIDPTKPARYAAAFSVERLASTPFESNLYVAQAPLKTTDHVEVLQALEALL